MFSVLFCTEHAFGIKVRYSSWTFDSINKALFPVTLCVRKVQQVEIDGNSPVNEDESQHTNTGKNDDICVHSVHFAIYHVRLCW